MKSSSGGSSRPFVGREQELSLLHQCLDRVRAGNKPEIVLIEGDYGTGKTALVERFLAEAKGTNTPVTCATGTCAMETRDNGLAPFCQLLVGLAEDAWSWRVIRDNLWDFLKKAAPAWLDIVQAGVASAIVTTIEAGRELVVPRQSRPFPEQVFTQFVNALGELTARKPAIAFIDNLQWADETSLRLLFHLANNLKKVPIVVIAAYRPVEAMEIGKSAGLFREICANLLAHGAQAIELHTGIAVAEYVCERYRANDFSSTLLGRIEERTEGHPLFLSELFSLWEHTGVIRCEPSPGGQGIWHLAAESVGAMPLPSNLGAVLDQRLRSLEKQLLKDILNRASVEGEDFTVQTVRNLLQLDELEAYDNVDALEKHYRLVQEEETRTIGSVFFDFYRFAHRFFREHIYGQLSKGQRRILHRQVGECLEKLCDDPLPVAAHLSRHFAEAHENAKAARYALMAARFEQSHYAWAESRELCSRGLDLLGQLPDSRDTKQLRLDLLEQLGQACYYQGAYAEAAVEYESVIKLAQEVGADSQRIAGLCARMADICDEQGDYPKWRTFVALGWSMLARSDQPLCEAHVGLKSMESLLHSRLGDNEEAIRLAQAALADCEKLPQTPSLAHILVEVYDHLGIALGSLDRYVESVGAYRKAIDIAEGVGDDYLMAICFANLADDLALDGKLDEAHQSVLQAIEIAHRLGSLDSEGWAYAIKGSIDIECGAPEEAIGSLQAAIGLLDRASSVWGYSSAHANLAIAHLALSQVEAAHEHAMSAVSRAGDDPTRRAEALAALARVESAQQNWASVEEHFEEAIALHLEDEGRGVAARTQRQYAEALLCKGEREKPATLLRDALSTLQDLGWRFEADKTREILLRAGV